MIRLLLLLSMGLGLSGCASQLSSFLGFGAPVSSQRCRAMDLEKMGLEDGRTGQRPGEKYDFWIKDCRIAGVPLDRALYDKGYAEGIKSYCSCEAGFAAGVRDEYTEIKGQFFNCPKVDYAVYMQGHEAGKKYVNDPTMMKKVNHYKNDYFDDVITPKAALECKALAEAKAAVPAPAQADDKKASGTKEEPAKSKSP
ncbi:MAG: DUF2799 domain-containing protein [Bdellovibrio sp.]|jgi:hypothetical protein